MRRDVRIAVYGDLNMNVIDGSSIWLQSVVTALSQQPRNHVTLVLRAGEQRDLLTGPLHRLAGVTVVNPVDQGEAPGPELTRNQALDTLEALDAAHRFDAFVLRGFALCHAAATRKRQLLVGRLWPYLTDIPQRSAELTGDALARLQAVAAASRHLLCQTEQLRSYLESWVPGVAGKAVLLEPMLPDRVPARAPPPAPLGDGEALRLIYVGKYAPMWNTLEMIKRADALRRGGAAIELHMVGDKIHRPKDDPEWAERMERALSSTPGVVWHAGKSREQTLAMLAGFHVALGWRSAELDDSLELSTKLLEYGAVGIPAIINRTSMHEELLGVDYPLFGNSTAEFDRAIARARDPEVRRLAVARLDVASRRFTAARVAERLQCYIDRAAPRGDALVHRRRPLRIVLACHDFKFVGRIQEHLASLRGAELRVDAWPRIDQHDPAQSKALADWADVVVCEWCANNAVWYSRHKRAHQKLLVRLHRFELFGQYVKKIDIDKVDRMVFVGDYYRDHAIAELGWPAARLDVIPNWVDTRLLDRPKVGDACFNLGMIGFVPRLKRMDRAIEIVARLRAVDPRFRLHIKGKMPWDHPWIWSKPEEQEHYREAFARLNADPGLRGGVQFDGFGGDVAAWLRKIGFVLSTSDLESFHLAAAEGMASRAPAMILPWAGAEKIYPDGWIQADEDAVVEGILSLLDGGGWQARGEEMREFIDARYSVEKICARWEQLVTA